MCFARITKREHRDFFLIFYAGMVWSCRNGSVRIRGHGRPEAASKPDYRLLFSGANATGGLKIPQVPQIPTMQAALLSEKDAAFRV